MKATQQSNNRMKEAVVRQDRRLVVFSRWMAVSTLVLMTLALIVNIVCWCFPEFAQERLGFSFSAEMISMAGVDIQNMPGWQWFGGLMISCVPLAVLFVGALNLHRLFSVYAQGHYLSADACTYMGRAGSATIAWVIASFLGTPVMSLWLTLNAPIGQRFVSVGIGSTEVVALFLGACFWLIARILRQASAVYQEIDILPLLKQGDSYRVQRNIAVSLAHLGGFLLLTTDRMVHFTG